jgi:selenocysteine lyase/cysteine desulfurase
VAGVAFNRVEQLARDAGVAVRSGCFCNPGAAERAFAADHAMGAVRASLGIASNERDVTRLVDNLDRCTSPAAARR